jgi:hypothetical protein
MRARSPHAPAWFVDVDGLLRREGSWALGAPWRRLLVILVVAGFSAGAAMGSWSGDPRAVLASAIKLPLVLVGSALVCLPSFWVANTVLGLRDDAAAALRALASGQAVLAVVLASLAPVTAFLYMTTDEYHLAKVLNGSSFVLATLASHGAVKRRYRTLVARDRRHRLPLAVWPVLQLLVCLQLTWALRPFIGHPDAPFELLRDDWWGNVFSDLWWTVRGALNG